MFKRLTYLIEFSQITWFIDGTSETDQQFTGIAAIGGTL